MGSKRHPALIPLSHEHREILAFCLQLKKGLQTREKIVAMGSLAMWFWENYIREHFKKEEQYVFPLLVDQKPLQYSLTSQHKEIAEIFEAGPISYHALIKLEKKLREHIRFEERIVFQKLQEDIPDKALNQLRLSSQGAKLCFWNAEK